MTFRRYRLATIAIAVAALIVAALFAVGLLGCGRAQAQALRPGVGYTPISGINTSCDPWAVRSIAVAGVGADGVVTMAQPHALAAGDIVLSPRTRATVASAPSPTTLTLNGSLPAPGDHITTWYLRSLMACRYGTRWEGGVQGPHSTDYATYLRSDFAAHTARWNPDYSLYDGNPTDREINDAYYSRDRRVLPLPVRPTPTPVLSPTATPPPQPTPTVAPTPHVEPTPAATPAATPCPSCPPPVTCEACTKYERVVVPSKHARTVEFAGTWSADNEAKLVERFKRLQALAVWLGGQLNKLYVPGVRTTPNITSTIESCRDLGKGCWQCDELTAPVCVEAAP